MGKPVLSKKDLAYLSKISSATEQTKLAKRLLEEKAEGLERSSKAFAKLRADRKARIEADPDVQVLTSKRGRKFIVPSGGGLLSSIWLSVAGAKTLISMVPQIKALIPELVEADAVVVEEDSPETDK